ncbi:TetR/AcrR family transcriptional regulator [Nocardia sp. alder85J]|uniref:TetR/AcrR family transcriptional regulator n=1 Tax=Nocardia sp. alder85J TaxID=2862949 RepID=UPI001CD226DE|nr:TetR/AcrR family transcriptional regulator [Nocardia sp. alder85J]MCX4091684.1 TetR/AcrR family transcriptional regulator [Nocardia sp. alder85J]
MPKLWNDTIASHRSQVSDAILDTTAALVFEQGLRAVTMAQIAERAGIGRATLYKYFPDVDAILHAWHGRQIGEHLRQLTAVRDGTGDPAQRLTAVLTSYAHIVQQTRSHDTELVKFLHPDQQIVDAQQHLRELIRTLIAEGASTGHLRADIDPTELANYCLHALTAAATLTDPAAVTRLIDLTRTGLRAPGS